MAALIRDGKNADAEACESMDVAALVRGHWVTCVGRVEMAPAFVDAWNNLGVLLTEAELLEEACECFRRALAADPHNAMAHYNLADTLTDMGRDCEAVRHWKAYLQVDSQSERAGYARRQIG